MRKQIRNSLAVVLLLISSTTYAQQVNTLYFLENAPMRHLVNPAFQPVSNGYLNFTPLGYTSFWIGNNSFSMSDFVFTNPMNPNSTITVLHPDANRDAFLKKIRKTTLIDGEATMDILGFGFRVKEKGYFTFGIMEHLDMGGNIPRDFFHFMLGGGMEDISGGNNYFNLGGFGTNVNVYTELAFGYSHKINDEWTVGGKLKFLMGTAHARINANTLDLNASIDEWHFNGQMDVELAGPLNMSAIPDGATIQDIISSDFSSLLPLENGDLMSTIGTFVKPAGYGGAIDIGFPYKPIEQVQITAAVNDLGFISWGKKTSAKMSASMDTTFVGVGDFDYGDYVVDGVFSTDSLLSDVKNNAAGLLDAARVGSKKGGFTNMVSMKLNVGVDANFWDNRIGVGILSRTRLYNRKLYEEVTIGAALRPCNWFNLALSYSLVDNGHYSSIGAGLSFMPYDGVNLTLALDYIPTVYTKSIPIPYHMKGVNAALGFSIVWGTNHKKDKDKDGVFDQFDMCPNTPKNVKVDALGCPIDSDGDGIPDYLDKCPFTSEKAYGLIDTLGCPIDSDGDGVPDYEDECPNTPKEALGLVDEKGCELDTDGDGVPDWRDDCPGTPLEAKGFIDERGCLLDTDGDGVPDYLDECPNTPAGAIGLVDEKGCELDSDGDSVPDWRDLCPNTPVEARGFIDANGCELDTDGDGVPDWQDKCPTTAGPAINKGCPEVKREVRTLLQKAMKGIAFDNGKATIKKKSYPLLDQIAQTFIDNPDFIIEVQGHTDNVGKAKLNKELSEKRANAVMNYLIGKGVPAGRMTAKGFGDEMPIADNKTKAGREKNRRVEFNITFEEVTVETILEHADSTQLRQMEDSIKASQLPTDSVAKDKMQLQ